MLGSKTERLQGAWGLQPEKCELKTFLCWICNVDLKSIHKLKVQSYAFSSAQSLSRVLLFATP